MEKEKKSEFSEAWCFQAKFQAKCLDSFAAKLQCKLLQLHSIWCYNQSDNINCCYFLPAIRESYNYLHS